MRLNASASQDPARSGVSIRLNIDHFDLVTNMLGHTTWQAKAAFIGMDPAAITRARNGKNVSDKFVAGTLAALGKHRDWFAEKNTPVTFEALFEVVESTGVDGSPLAIAEQVAS